jgi:hypothetical protein
MTNDNEKIPPFIQDYLNKMDHEGYADFVKLSRAYHKEREDYPGKHAVQSKYLNDYNRTTGKNKTLNYEDGLNRIDADFKKEAYATAKQHGYTGPDPNQPSDKDFTKQGEKFQSMIDHAKQRQHQQEQKPEATKGHEKKNIETLKEQKPYQQNPPKVEFKGMEQPSGTEQQSRDQQRTAFLEQIKKSREQQIPSQQNKQPEL